mmetsp:Transcript_11861/g.21533  ORF Transcript_11861/g.21533 Transcript_11861/m.21533 type:complete len:236 (+) Transcript_11861:1349-2056(+)
MDSARPVSSGSVKRVLWILRDSREDSATVTRATRSVTSSSWMCTWSLTIISVSWMGSGVGLREGDLLRCRDGDWDRLGDRDRDWDLEGDLDDADGDRDRDKDGDLAFLLLAAFLTFLLTLALSFLLPLALLFFAGGGLALRLGLRLLASSLLLGLRWGDRLEDTRRRFLSLSLCLSLSDRLWRPSSCAAGGGDLGGGGGRGAGLRLRLLLRRSPLLFLSLDGGRRPLAHSFTIRS